jgi:hypothetical protein
MMASGTMTPIPGGAGIPGTDLALVYPYFCETLLPLDKYARFIGYSECAFFGVSHPDNARYACSEIWTKYQRDMISQYLCEAQLELELEVGFPITARWIEDERKYRSKIVAKYGKILSVGVKKITSILDNAVVNHATDPATIVINPVSITSTTGVKVYYPGTEVEINPVRLTLSGVILTIQIPRCRMVKFDLIDNPAEGLDYSVIANFQSTVDVKLIENDPTTQAELVWIGADNCGSNGCSETVESGCEYIINSETGIISAAPAVYSGGAWTSKGISCPSSNPDKVRLRYKAGLTELSPLEETIIIRLAHSKMPEEPCGCDIVQRLWRRDRHIPELLTRERLNCPYGLSDGAWTAWRFSQDIKLYRAVALS